MKPDELERALFACRQLRQAAGVLRRPRRTARALQGALSSTLFAGATCSYLRWQLGRRADPWSTLRGRR